MQADTGHTCLSRTIKIRPRVYFIDTRQSYHIPVQLLLAKFENELRDNYKLQFYSSLALHFLLLETFLLFMVVLQILKTIPRLSTL